MSLFSSLNYLLMRAASASNHMKGHQNELFEDSTTSSSFSLIVDDEKTSANITSNIRYGPLLLGALTFYIDAEINKTITTKQENWTKFTDLPTTATHLELESKHLYESNGHFSNEKFPNAVHLLESWWNIFDTRYLRHGWGLTITLIIAYTFILVAGVIGNVMVILVVLLRPRMRSVTNMFILNLAVADLFVIVFCVPSTLLANIFTPWILGTYMCKAVAYVQGVSVCAAAYSLAAISFDRCQAVYRNYERPRGFSRRTWAKTVIVIWLAAMSLTIPWAVIFEVKVSEYDGLRYCVEKWSNEKDGNIYFLVVNFLCFYAIPSLLIFASNWIIYCHVAKRTVPQDSASSEPLRKMHRDTRRHVIKMLAIVTLTFLISWLPVYILVIIIKFSDYISDSEYKVLGILIPIAQWLGTLNSSINPILYAFLNKKFRKMFESILPAWIPVKFTKMYVSLKTPSFTTASSEKSPRRYIAASKTNNHRNELISSQYQANVPNNKPKEHMATLVKNTIHSVSCTLLEVPTVCVSRPILINNKTAIERISNDIVAHL